MKKILLVVLLQAWLLSGFTQALTVQYLQCENRVDPLGLDNTSPALSWELRSTGRGVMQTAYRVLVSDSKEKLAANNGNIWDSKKVKSDASIQVRYSGAALGSAAVYFWKVMVWDNKGKISPWSETASWQMGLLSPADWKGAAWIGYEALPDSAKIIPAAHGKGKKEWGAGKDILPLLRKEFSTDKAINRASAFICGLGHFELMLNGKKAGDHFLDPGWTKYDKEAQYVTFDITDLVKKGNNAVGVMLGNGFYYQPRERYRKLTGAFGYPKMICRILIEYKDGSVENIISDQSWKAVPGPIIFSSIYGGEDHNANLEKKGWDEPYYIDNKWNTALVVTGPPVLYSQMTEPLKVFDEFKPEKATRLNTSQWVFDLGQNASGIPRITVKGKKGDTVRIRPAELLNEDGSANQKATGSPTYFTYILKGEGDESWQPRFTYTGFRYLQVEGAAPDSANAPLLPKLISLTGLHTRNASVSVGNFSSSNELFNRTHTLIDWALKSNMASLFTDCPHREKLGWLEQTHLMGGSIRYDYDIAALCKKVVRDMMQSQTAEGLVPEIAPEFVQFEEPFRDSPEWGSAAVLLPWYIYQWYGDKQTLQDAYPMIKKYIAYLQSKAKGNILRQGLGDWFDLGPAKPGVSQLTPQGITATAFYYHDLTIASGIAALLENKNDVIFYDQLASAVKQTFNDSFFNKQTVQYGSGSQTANAIALYMGLVEKAYRVKVLENIISDIKNRNNSLTAGDIGYRYLLRVLDDAGRSDVIYAMNNRDDVPGYGYQLAHGATALTESWQALPAVSNNHLMLGHLQEWFYSGVAGIRPGANSVAFKTIEIRPQPVGDLTSAKAGFHSPYGMISTAWMIKDNKFYLNLHIPANTKARVILPAYFATAITESGKAVNNRGDIKVIEKLLHHPELEIGSGDYSFIVNDYRK